MRIKTRPLFPHRLILIALFTTIHFQSLSAKKEKNLSPYIRFLKSATDRLKYVRDLTDLYSIEER